MRKWFWVAVMVGGLLIGGLVARAVQTEDFSDFAGTWDDTDFSQTSVARSEIRFGGPPPDGIPPYYPPGYRYPDNAPVRPGEAPLFTVEYTSIEDTNTYLPDEQQVIVVEVEGEARAYPLLLLNNHEIVNTEIAGIPVAVTFCPLCNASIVYERTLEGQVYHFGVSGLLRNSDMIMWDHETQSWWQQFTGQAIVGTLNGQQLNRLPSLVVSWGEFKAEYPDGRVLANIAGRSTEAISYAGYDQSNNPFLFDGEIDDRLPPTERVLGYFGREGAIAYPFSTLAGVGIVNDTIGGRPVVVFWQPGADSLFSPGLETGSAGLYRAELPDGTALTFTADEQKVIRDEQTGSVWNVFGRAIEGELAGTRLTLQYSYPHFWFAWAAFQPETLIWEQNMVADEAWNSAE